MSTDLDALVPYLRAIEHHLARCAEALERLAELRDEEATDVHASTPVETRAR